MGRGDAMDSRRPAHKQPDPFPAHVIFTCFCHPPAHRLEETAAHAVKRSVYGGGTRGGRGTDGSGRAERAWDNASSATPHPHRREVRGLAVHARTTAGAGAASRETGRGRGPQEPSNRTCLPGKLLAQHAMSLLPRGTFTATVSCLSTQLNRSFLTSLWHSPKREKIVGGYGIRSKTHTHKKKQVIVSIFIGPTSIRF